MPWREHDVQFFFFFLKLYFKFLKIPYTFVQATHAYAHAYVRTHSRYITRVFYSFRFSEFLMPAAEHLPGSVSVQKNKRRSRACETTLLANVATVTSRHAARQEISSTNTNSLAFEFSIAECSVLFGGADPTSVNMSDTHLRSLSSGSNQC